MKAHHAAMLYEFVTSIASTPYDGRRCNHADGCRDGNGPRCYVPAEEEHESLEGIVQSARALLTYLHTKESAS